MTSQAKKSGLDRVSYKALLESTKAIPWQIDWKTMRFTYIGPQIEALLGWTPGSWVSADDWAARMHPEDREYVVNYCVSQSKAGIDHEADYRALTKNGGYVWIRDVVHVTRNEMGEVESLIGFMFDISERKRVEGELIALQQEIAHHQTLSDERQRLMQDMHDGMGSSLLTALLGVERGHFDAAMVADVLKNCIDDLKLTIDSMEPIQADLLLLLATLRFRLGPRLESAGIKLRWEVGNVPRMEWIDPRNALHILRILQEAFANIVKHAAATEIRVATRVESDSVLVIVTDNGVGFLVDEGMGKDGKGLRNQQRRAASIGAAVKVEPGNPGIRLTLQLPISPVWRQAD